MLVVEAVYGAAGDDNRVILGVEEELVLVSFVEGRGCRFWGRWVLDPVLDFSWTSRKIGRMSSARWA